MDDDLLTRASELLKEASLRKRNRDDDPPLPPPMFALPKASLADLTAVDDEYTKAVLAAASTYLNSGGKACKPVDYASAGSIGRKQTYIIAEPSAESSAGIQPHLPPHLPASVPPESAPVQPTHSDALEQPLSQCKRAPAPRAVAFKCRRCGCAKRAHQCPEAELTPQADANALSQLLSQQQPADQRLRPWSMAEDDVICSGVQELGYKWSHIAERLDGRTDNAVRNRWHRLEAARKWREEMAGKSDTELSGYKCGRCGQLKRGHACPYGLEAAPPSVSAVRVLSGDATSPSESTLGEGTLAEGTEAELAALFASLEACPAGDEDEEDELCGLAQDVLSPLELEEIMSERQGSQAQAQIPGMEAVEWETLHSSDGTTWRQAIDATGDWNEVEGSADGAVCF